jgi:hypothetical protein
MPWLFIQDQQLHLSSRNLNRKNTRYRRLGILQHRTKHINTIRLQDRGDSEIAVSPNCGARQASRTRKVSGYHHFETDYLGRQQLDSRGLICVLGSVGNRKFSKIMENFRLHMSDRARQCHKNDAAGNRKTIVLNRGQMITKARHVIAFRSDFALRPN